MSLPSQTIGPFFNYALTVNKALGRVNGQGERISLRLRLLDGDEIPVPDGMLEVWQADARGVYRHPADSSFASTDAGFVGFARLETNQDGVCLFDTIRPGSAGTQAAHINLTVFARGLLAHLNTRIYFDGDPALDLDPVLALIPLERRSSLVATLGLENLWSLDLYLQGPRETVFFEL